MANNKLDRGALNYIRQALADILGEKAARGVNPRRIPRYQEYLGEEDLGVPTRSIPLGLTGADMPEALNIWRHPTGRVIVSESGSPENAGPMIYNTSRAPLTDADLLYDALRSYGYGPRRRPGSDYGE